MVKLSNKTILLISKVIIKLFTFMKGGLSKEEQLALADDLADIAGELIK